MQFTHLGRSGLSVSKLCLGTMNFGTETSEKESQLIMDRALDAGIMFFDTANAYGYQVHVGHTEEIIGRWFAKGGGRREKVVLATKVYGDMGPGPNDRRLSARHIRDACEASLKRLKTDCIDLYQMHHGDPDTPFEEIWQAMDRLVAEGKVLYVGSCNYAAWQICELQGIARARHHLGLVSEQSIYHLAQRAVELEVLPACRHLGLGFLPWSPLAGGLLGGVLGKLDGGRRSQANMAGPIADNRAKLERYEALCAEHGVSPATVSLAWLMHQDGVTAPIIGPRTSGQLDTALAAVELELDAGALASLDEIWPGPGAAPKAYAW